ncbi:chemotaxis protein CheA [Anaerocolumna xylanovorans]|uniref:Chemotaxis protein CheA n=1 Tax=Anaerocolumna xylanovorans DSM 12503 TaxID=1121345 RepID=A0A1M7YL02_9FIRM|nr:chemotaxis protein CheA [Anaerocolumna xylanovorans]SHO53272.1 two-component system, chemotaxis family, sensor kinase CheA [Anaerocolumna xylanovorans DSM 12503]
MQDKITNEPMLDVYIFETSQLLEQLEQTVLKCEKGTGFAVSDINEIFRIMHTIKGSSAMMMFQNISVLAHTAEDLFYFLREEKPEEVDCSFICDAVFQSIDFIKVELEKIKNGDKADGDSKEIAGSIKNILSELKANCGSVNMPIDEKRREEKPKKYYISQDRVNISQYKYAYKAVIFFEDDCELENIRAFTVIHELSGTAGEICHEPENLEDTSECIEKIQKDGFLIFFQSNESYEQIKELLENTIFLKKLELTNLGEKGHENSKDTVKAAEGISKRINDVPKEGHSSANQGIISVNVSKLDKLMDLVGEMVIAEAMVTQNPDLKGLELGNFHKAARQLKKITDELQDTVMSVRMVPLGPVFLKMQRIVRDMSKQLKKEITLQIIGEDTEVDKNIIEHISDPLMHLVRNAADHGIEPPEERLMQNKDRTGVITLEAKNAGGDVRIIVRDDGKGLKREDILKKAQSLNLLPKNPEEMEDKEVFNLLFLPGFSTKDDVSEYSGRGVGMDVVMQNIRAIGGTVTVDSKPGKGMSTTLSIPLTLAIIDGMNLRVGDSYYTIPMVSIIESLRPRERDIIIDPEGREILMIRGQSYPVLRLHRLYDVKTKITCFTEGIIVVVRQEGKLFCIFADELIGQQQVVVKSLPAYIRKMKQIKGLAGCTLLGDGSISLILDAAGLADC